MIPAATGRAPITSFKLPSSTEFHAAAHRRFENQCAKAGIHRIHGQRHEYAQMRYQELTGWAAPVAGGPRSKEMTAAQKLLDREARLTINRDLGHEREQIAANLGR